LLSLPAIVSPIWSDEQGRPVLGAATSRLRVALGRLDELQAVIARVNQDNDRLRAERDELLAAFRRMADVIEQLRQSRGGGCDG
jgi:hypothetical protein